MYLHLHRQGQYHGIDPAHSEGNTKIIFLRTNTKTEALENF